MPVPESFPKQQRCFPSFKLLSPTANRMTMGQQKTASSDEPSREDLVGECNDGREDYSVFVDTGSQVTMLRKSTFQRVFGENGVKLIDPSTWMTLTIPYVGCALLNITIGSVTVERC